MASRRQAANRLLLRLLPQTPPPTGNHFLRPLQPTLPLSGRGAAAATDFAFKIVASRTASRFLLQDSCFKILADGDGFLAGSDLKTNLQRCETKLQVRIYGDVPCSRGADADLPRVSMDIRNQLRDHTKDSSSSDDEPDSTTSRSWSSYTCFADVTFYWPREYVLHPLDQGKTDSCYAATAITLLFADMKIYNKHQTALQGSRQELMDRVYKENNPTLIAGPRGLPERITNVFEYVKDKGVYPEKEYPWEGRCQPIPRDVYEDEGQMKIFIKGYHVIFDGDRDVVREQIRRRPIAGQIICSKSFITWDHKNAVFPGATTEEIMELKKAGKAIPYHLVAIIGYGGCIGIDDFYLCQNSYGKHWGREALFRVRSDAIKVFSWPEGTTHLDVKRSKATDTEVPKRVSEEDGPVDMDID